MAEEVLRLNRTSAAMLGVPLTGLFSLLPVIGTSLSIVAVVLTVITYSLFSDLRRLSGASLLNLLGALFLAHVVSVIGIERPADKGLCIALGFLVQYLWLAAHTWLGAMSRDAYQTFKDNINLEPSPVIEDRKSFLRTAGVCWGLPTVLTSTAAVLRYLFENPRDDSVSPTCWANGARSFVWTFCVPAVSLAALSVYFLLKGAQVIKYTSSLQMNRRTRDKMKRRRYLQLFLCAKLLLVLTFAWVAGLVAHITRTTAAWFVFSLVASLQGFLVSTAYSCNSKVFRLYSRSLKSQRRSGTLAGRYRACELSGLTDMVSLTSRPTPEPV